MRSARGELVRAVTVGALTLALMVGVSQLGSVAHADVPDPTSSSGVQSALGGGEAVGPASDGNAIRDAAESYTAGDAESTVELVDSASAATAVEVDVQGDAFATVDGDVVADGEGSISMALPSFGEVTLSVPGADREAAEAVSNALVWSEVNTETDVVARAVPGGVQVVAVLGENAPTTVSFDVTLPPGAQLQEQADGSIAVVAPTITESVLPGEFERVSESMEAIVGPEFDDLEDLSDSQWRAMASIPDAQTVLTLDQEQVAVISRPWAVDAAGREVATHYVLTDDGLAQVIETDADTVFPVVADPAWYWWVWTATSCVADLATFLFAAAKLAKALIKVEGLIKKSAKLAAVVKKLGGAKESLVSIYKAAKGFLESGRVGKYLSNSKLLALSALVSAGLSFIGDALGIGSCVSLIRELL